MLPFYFAYIATTLIFFWRTSNSIIQSAKNIHKQITLTDEEMDQLCATYLAKVIFQAVMMFVFPLSLWLYMTINEKFSDSFFISSGLFTIFWLIFTGYCIRFLYYIATNKFFRGYPYDTYFEDKEFFWVMCPLLYGILVSIYDKTLFFIILAIVLGKFIWMDFFPKFSFSHIKKRLKVFFRISKINLLLLFTQACITGFLIIRFSYDPYNLIATMLLFVLFLERLVDIIIYDSMQSYTNSIIRLRK